MNPLPMPVQPAREGVPPRSPAGFFATPQPVHFVGIGGSGMCGLAECLLRRGFRVSGSDALRSRATQRLESLGARIRIGHDADNLAEDARLVVRTLAVDETNPEVARALQRGLPVIRYAELLGRVMSDRFGIAVSGCHGKTTTTGMVAHALQALGQDPTFVVGGTLPGLDSGSRVGDGPHFVVEACEYARSFHHLRAHVAVVTNIEADHLDYYRDLDEIVEAFAQFLGSVPAGGTIVHHGEDPTVRNAVDRAIARWGASARRTPFGTGTENPWRIVDPRMVEGRAQATLHTPEGKSVEIRLPVPGVHNVWNATAAIAALAASGIGAEEAARALQSFPGIARRMQRLAERDGSILMDDYAHHPTEISAVLAAARRIPGITQVVAIYQPHQHGRTRRHLEEFADALARADLAVVPDIYSARETEEEIRSVSAVDLVRAIVDRGGRAEYRPAGADIVARVGAALHPGTLVVTMGAGDVHKFAEAIRAAHFGGA